MVPREESMLIKYDDTEEIADLWFLIREETHVESLHFSKRINCTWSTLISELEKKANHLIKDIGVGVGA